MTTIEELKDIVTGQWYPQSVNDVCAKAANELEALTKERDELLLRVTNRDNLAINDGNKLVKALVEREALRTQLTASESERVEAYHALEGMSELCGNYFDESQLVCERDRAIWSQMLNVLKNTPESTLLKELDELRRERTILTQSNQRMRHAIAAVLKHPLVPIHNNTIADELRASVALSTPAQPI